MCAAFGNYFSSPAFVRSNPSHLWSLSRPVGIAAKERVIFWGTEKAYNSKLLYELIPQFLCTSFVESALAQITFYIGVQENFKNAADRHGRTVCFLQRSQVGENRSIARPPERPLPVV